MQASINGRENGRTSNLYIKPLERSIATSSLIGKDGPGENINRASKNGERTLKTTIRDEKERKRNWIIKNKILTISINWETKIRKRTFGIKRENQATSWTQTERRLIRSQIVSLNAEETPGINVKDEANDVGYNVSRKSETFGRITQQTKGREVKMDELDEIAYGIRKKKSRQTAIIAKVEARERNQW